MSVILYNPERFQRIAATLSFMIKKNADKSIISDSFHTTKESDTQLKARTLEFANDLHRSNVSCWNQQYEESREVLEIHESNTPFEKIALVKSLRGVSYNLAENSGYQHSFKGCAEILKRLINCLQSDIVSELPKYKKAEW